ncbi:MAG: MFS transporter [Deltaproteobacteria bacterium]|nr:MFS transporter [Deltaproteobacteria bacterium]
MTATEYPRRNLLAWYLYDFGMATFSTVVVTAFYVVYFKHVVVGKGDPRGDFLWGAAVSATMLLVALIAPVLGAIADHAGKKRLFLVVFAGMAIASTYALCAVGPGMVAAGMALFVTGYLGYTGAMPFYNGFLMEVAPRERWPRVSGIGWGLGYFGGLTSLLMILPFAQEGVSAGGIGSARTIFVITGTLYLVFALPAFVLLKDPPSPGLAGRGGKREGLGEGEYLRVGLSRLADTFRTVREHGELWKFLLAFFLFNDAIATVITFFAVYAKDTLGFSMKENVFLLMAVQVTAALGAFASGWLARVFGLRNAIALTLVVWIAAVLGAFFAQTKAHFWVVAVTAGTVLGATQAAARTLVAELAPTEKKAEVFGFMAVCGKLAAVFGPLVFGIISSYAGGQRYAILSVEFFFVAGLAVLMTVRRR